MFTGQFRFLAHTLCIYNSTQWNVYDTWGSEALECGWLERSMEDRTITTALVAGCNHEVSRRDLSQGMRCTQTCATTQSEQTLLVPIEAPPFNGLHVKYNIVKGHDDEIKR